MVQIAKAHRNISENAVFCFIKLFQDLVYDILGSILTPVNSDLGSDNRQQNAWQTKSQHKPVDDKDPYPYPNPAKKFAFLEPQIVHVPAFGNDNADKHDSGPPGERP